MKVASILGISFFGMLVVSVIFIFIGRDLRPRYKHRRVRLPAQIVGCFLGGAAMFLWGSLSLCFAYNSPIMRSIGTIAHIRAGTSRSSSPGPNFDLVTDNGESIAFSSAEHAIYRMEGERVQVSFVQYDNDLLDLQVVSGADAGFRLHRSPNNAVWWCLALMGLLMILGAYHSLPSDQQF